MNTQEFIEKARAIHGDKYDYSKVEYVNPNTKVCIICPEHGEFLQAPYSHLSGCACKKCANSNLSSDRKDSLEAFIRKAKEVHGDKYDYSKVEYEKSTKKVCIICPKHGEFWQTPGSHLSGCGCRKCLGNYRLTTEEFIKKSREVHGDKYGYSKVKYLNGNTKVCIICPEHGQFWQNPIRHLGGSGCPKCADINRASKKRMSLVEFIEKANEIHNNKYNYSKVEYVNCDTKVCIICPEHGEFWQTPYKHLYENGCPFCNHGLPKQYKFNLLQEFESEYELRAFLENNDVNILYVILRNIEPKFEPIKADIENVLKGGKVEDPIKALEDKYTKDEEDDEEEPTTNGGEKEVTATTTDITNVDLDDDDAINQILDSDDNDEDGETNQEPTIEEIIKNTEKELEVVAKIEHMLTPEDREYIMQKFLNDKTRIWMAEREALKNV